MLKKLPDIVVRKGASSIVKIDLSTFDFCGGKVVFSIRPVNGVAIYTKEFTEQGEFYFTIQDNVTAKMKLNTSYIYDVMWHLGDQRFAQCLPSDVILYDTVGGECYDRT